MKMKLSSSLLFLALMNMGNSAYSQGGFVPLSQDYITERFEAHTTIASSSEDINAIPLHEIYRTVFLKILGNPTFLNQFSKADIKILTTLPDHSDSSFRRALNSDLKQACEEINRKLESSQVSDLVSIFIDAEKKSDLRLHDHYESVIGSLSAEGAMLVSYRIEELSKGNSITHAETNYVALSTDLPDLMKERLLSGCKNVQSDSRALQPKLLTDNFVHRNDLFKNDN